MKITQIKQQVKDQTRVSIFLEGKYCFSLTLDQLLYEKLKKGDELDEQRIDELKKMSDEGKLRTRALEWLMGRPHSTREFRDYLYRKKASKEHIDALVEEFGDKKYLNDEYFAKWFAEGRLRKNKSTRAIRSELMSKGISPATIQNIVTELETGDKEALKTLVNKLRTRPRYHDEQKLKAYLVSKGFRYEDIKNAIKE
ncbi:MAG: RecX family transcriptional regulator [Candidatus Saccharibacteria bacterium]|nr:RecX family transcriptional regulator [Candidatus Saccharibacteria bacterium]